MCLCSLFSINLYPNMYLLVLAYNFRYSKTNKFCVVHDFFMHLQSLRLPRNRTLLLLYGRYKELLCWYVHHFDLRTCLSIQCNIMFLSFLYPFTTYTMTSDGWCIDLSS